MDQKCTTKDCCVKQTLFKCTYSHPESKRESIEDSRFWESFLYIQKQFRKERENERSKYNES